MRNSPNELERESLFLGYNATHEYAALLHSDLLFEHMHLQGATGIGKTALALIPIVIQLIRRGDGPVVIFDCKGDRAFLHTAIIEAERAGRSCKWATDMAGHSTYILNAFDQEFLNRLTLRQLVGLFILAFNLYHGDDYGRAWFSILARTLFRRAVQSSRANGRHRLSQGRNPGRLFPRIKSFRDLDEIVYYLCNEGDEFKAARHLGYILESVSDLDNLNISKTEEPQRGPASHGINMSEVIRERQVLYFYLVGTIDSPSAAEIARLALYLCLCAAVVHRQETGKAPRVYTIWDEAQILIAQNIQTVLEQARSNGLACILSHQTMSQLKPPGGVDLRDVVKSCTNTKIYLAARDLQLINDISQSSGQTMYYTTSWTQSADDVLNGDVGLDLALPDNDRHTRVGVRESPGFIMTPQDIMDISKHPNQCILSIERGKGLSHFTAPFALHMDWPIPKDEYDRRSEMAWPELGESTIELPADAVDEPTSAIDIKHTKQKAGPSPSTVTQRLKDMKRKLDQEK